MKYIEIYEDIKNKILNGEYVAWKNLESESVLSQKYSVSRMTLRQAINKLKTEGYVHSRQGGNMYINPPEFYRNKLLQSLSEKEKNVTSKIISFEKILGTKEICEIFNRTKDSIFYKYERIRLIDSIPRMYELTYIPEELFPNFNEEVLKGSMLGYIEKKCGYKISHDLGKIQGILLDKKLAKYLKSKENQVALQIEHKVYLYKSVLAEYTKEIDISNTFDIAIVR
ncbi:GntR family transcriptional regulator [Fusobacterium sp.]|uniref:GntR family transcriptional regulator n=1 Tax=Fusobacterium sp. TaxID=68766 RepID=UPI0025BC8BF2|nr:GntR family transcriptional regulator [Fusobacterium sp.]